MAGNRICAGICALFLSFFALIGTLRAGDKDIKQNLIESLAQNPFFEKKELDILFENPLLARNEEELEKKCADFLATSTPDFFLLGDTSLALGLKFFDTYKDIFAAAEQDYSVPPEYIVAIIRVETYFGICTGTHFVLPRLYQLYTTQPKRREFLFREIEAFLELSKKYGWSPYDVRGSRAGAIGIPQFLPSSIKDFAVDGNGDGVIDLFNPPDFIPSVANFLVVNHWKRNKRAAIWNYNRDAEYVRNVLAYAEKLSSLMRERSTSPLP